jgi:integrase
MGRHKQPWTIFRRKGSRYYYYQTYDENGRRTAERSTGETSRARAEEYLRKLDREGRIVPKPRTTFREFARNWWVWPEGEDPVCPYVASLLAQDTGAIGREHVYNRRKSLEKHTTPYFDDTPIGEISREDVVDWISSLRADGLAAASVRQVFAGFRTMMRWALARRLIHEDPTIYVRAIGGSRDRGLLSLEEARALLDPGTIEEVWNRDLLHYTLSLVAASTGLRQGELLAIRAGDVHDGWIDVSHGYGRMSGEKETKTRRARISSIPSRATDYLRKISGEDPTSYVFSRDGVSPIS